MPGKDRPPRRPSQRDFFFNPRDYLADTQGMSTLARGAFSTLLFNLWTQPEPGVVCEQNGAAMRLAWATPDEWAQVRSEVAERFDTESRPGWWVQKRMVRERARQDSYYEQKRRDGKAGRRKQLAGLPRDSPGIAPGAVSASSAVSAVSAEENTVRGVDTPLTNPRREAPV